MPDSQPMRGQGFLGYPASRVINANGSMAVCNAKLKRQRNYRVSVEKNNAVALWGCKEAV